MFQPSGTDIVQAYSASGSYVPADPNTDNGAIELGVLNHWRQTGIAELQVLAFVALEPGQTQRVWSVPSGGAQKRIVVNALDAAELQKMNGAL